MICFGEILWDCLPSGKVLGGAQLNMSVQMHNIGLKPTLISAVGNDELGDELLDEIQKLGLDFSSIGRIDKYPTSRVEVTLDQEGKATYDIVMPVAWDAIPIRNDHLKVAASEGIIFGSMAQRMKDDSYKNLDILLEESSLNFFDANFRLPFTTKELMLKYLPKADIFKINDEELPILMTWLGEDVDEDNSLTFLADTYRIDHILLTKGSDGSKVLSQGTLYRHAGHKVEVVDTVGCGDSFTAGFVYGFKNDMSIPNTLEFASALSAVVASKKGGCCYVSIDEVKSLMNA